MKPTDTDQISIHIAAKSVGLAAVSVVLPTATTAPKVKATAPAIGATDFFSGRVHILSAESGILRDSFPNVFRKMRNTAGETPTLLETNRFSLFLINKPNHKNR